MYDYTIIGAGIVGTMIARALSAYNVETLILEKENDIANVQTSANSAIIHSGHDPKKNTLKAQLCVEGNKMYEDLEKELHIPLRYTGAFVVAQEESEIPMLQELFERSMANGVPECALISAADVHELEPNLNKNICAALSLPTTKVTFPWEVAIRVLHNAIKNGVTFRKNSTVTNIYSRDKYFEIEINGKDLIQTKSIINASGVHSDGIAQLLEKDVPYQIVPKRGEYFVLDRKADGFVNHVIYPLPSKKGKGVLITPQTHGNILLGPTSEIIVDPDDHSTSKNGLDYVREHVKLLSDHIPYQYLIRSFAGVRASSTFNDFYIKESKIYKNFYHVAGIDSPGLTSAPAIAKYLLEEIIKIDAPKNESYDPYLKADIVFSKLPFVEQEQLIKEKPLYGRVICQCEHVSEQEIIDAIQSPVGSDTIKGIKKRTRAGAGTCQGGYCQSHVLHIIARETGKEPREINYDQLNTHILDQESKVGK